MYTSLKSIKTTDRKTTHTNITSKTQGRERDKWICELNFLFIKEDGNDLISTAGKLRN